MNGPTISGAELLIEQDPGAVLGHGDEQGEGQRLRREEPARLPDPAV